MFTPYVPYIPYKVSPYTPYNTYNINPTHMFAIYPKNRSQYLKIEEKKLKLKYKNIFLLKKFRNVHFETHLSKAQELKPIPKSRRKKLKKIYFY